MTGEEMLDRVDEIFADTNKFVMPIPKAFRREERAIRNAKTPRRNDRSKKTRLLPIIRLSDSGKELVFWPGMNWSVIYLPKRKKLKGYQRDNKGRKI